MPKAGLPFSIIIRMPELQAILHTAGCMLGLSLPFYCFRSESLKPLAFVSRPFVEEPRHVKVQKGSEPLGISIVSGEKGGIYVSKVTMGSIAHQAGLEYGDQLLEVRGCVPSFCPLFLPCPRSLPQSLPIIDSTLGIFPVQWHKPEERH